MSVITKFLIIDDDLITRNALSRRISSLGYSVDTASSPTEAKEKLKVSQPVGVILDIMMPQYSGQVMDMNAGFDLAKELRINYPKLKVIFLTGRNDDEIEEIIIKAAEKDEINFVNFFRKPFEQSAFRSALAVAQT